MVGTSRLIDVNPKIFVASNYKLAMSESQPAQISKLRSLTPGIQAVINVQGLQNQNTDCTAEDSGLVHQIEFDSQCFITDI